MSDDIEKGPRFEEVEAHLGCVACGDVTGTWTTIDKETGLCRACWRAWRFSLPVTHPWLHQPAAYVNRAGRVTVPPGMGEITEVPSEEPQGGAKPSAEPWHQEEP